MHRSRLLACLIVSALYLSSLAGCTGSTPSPTANSTLVVLSATPIPTAAPTLAATVTPVPTAVPTLAATATPERKDRIPLWNSGYWYLLGVNYPWLNYGHGFWDNGLGIRPGVAAL